MEAFGLAASVITLTELAEKGLKFRRHFRNATDEIGFAALRVESLTLSLEALRKLQDGHRNDAAVQTDTLSLVDKTVGNAVVTLDRIYRLLPRAISDPSTKNRFRWIIRDRALYHELMDHLTHAEISVSTMFNTIAWQERQALAEHPRLLQKSSFFHSEDKLLEQTDKDNSTVSSHRRNDHLGSVNREVSSTASLCKNATHLFGLCSTFRTSASATSTLRSTYVCSVRLLLPASTCIKLDLLLRSQRFSRSTALSVGGARLAVHRHVPRNSSLMLAAVSGNLAEMQRLISTGAATPLEITEGGITPICLAIQHGHTTAVELLLSNGADVNESFGRKQTCALAWALKHRRLDICRVLLQYGASFHHLSIHGWSPLFYLWSRATRRDESSTDFISLLRSNTVEYPYLHAGLRDTEGWSLMQRVSVFGTPADVRELVSSGVDVFQPLNNGRGWTTLHNVVSYGAVDNFEVIFPVFEARYGRETARELSDDRKWTLLHIAIEGNHEQMARKLIALGSEWEDARTLPCTVRDLAPLAGMVEYSPILFALAVGEHCHRWLLRAIDEIVLDHEDCRWFDSDDDIWYDAIEQMCA